MVTPDSRLLCVLFSSAVSSGCLAREICWIDHVSAANDGVAIYFSSPSSLRVIVQPRGSTELDVYHVSNGAVSRDKSESSRLQLSAGATVYINQGPEDMCTLEVIDESDKRGVMAKATNSMPGTAAAKASHFIQAE
jgi:hypothetical protein